MKSVSVVLCTYNGEKYLAEQLDSILGQSYPISELIIKDDCSTDGTIAIIEEYRRRCPAIRLIVNGSNLGYNINYLSAIALASGDYIAISDQDDIWEPAKIETMVSLLESSSKQACFCRSAEFSDDPGIEPFFDPRRPNCNMERMMVGNMASGHNLLITRELASKCTLDLYNRTSGWYYDYFVAALAAADDSLEFCDKVLVHYRRHAAQVTAYHDRGEINREGALKTLRKAVRNYFVNADRMKAFFDDRYNFFASIPSESTHMADALMLARLFTRRDIISYCRLTLLCVRLRREIFYTSEVPPLALFLRSWLFPLYCGIYFSD